MTDPGVYATHSPAVRFASVGVASTIVHLLVGLALLTGGIAPLVANAIAFSIAAGASFAGHYHYSFAGHGEPSGRASIRFSLVALCTFALNECLLWALVHSAVLPTGVSLALSTVSVAILSFVWNKRLVFRFTR